MNYIENWIYFLRQFINIAIRWDITAIKAMTSERFPFSAVFQDYYVMKNIEFWELFKKEYREKKLSMNDTEKQNFYSDLEFEFKSLYIYLSWYEKNKDRIEAFNPYNPYEILKNNCLDPLNEIGRINMQLAIKNEQTKTTMNFSNSSSLNTDLSNLELLISKKQFLEKELITTYDAEKKFALQQQIKDLKSRILELKK